MVIYAAVRFGVTPAINALATMMLGVTVLLILADGHRPTPRSPHDRCRGEGRAPAPWDAIG